MVQQFVEVETAPQAMIDKMTGEEAARSKLMHVFSSYTVKPVACDHKGGRSHNTNSKFAGKQKLNYIEPLSSDRTLQRWNKNAEVDGEVKPGGPGRFFTNSNYIKIP